MIEETSILKTLKDNGIKPFNTVAIRNKNDPKSADDVVQRDNILTECGDKDFADLKISFDDKKGALQALQELSHLKSLDLYSWFKTPESLLLITANEKISPSIERPRYEKTENDIITLALPFEKYEPPTYTIRNGNKNMEITVHTNSVLQSLLSLYDERVEKFSGLRKKDRFSGLTFFQRALEIDGIKVEEVVKDSDNESIENPHDCFTILCSLYLSDQEVSINDENKSPENALKTISPSTYQFFSKVINYDISLMKKTQ
jgi:hypothetical protein